MLTKSHKLVTCYLYSILICSFLLITGCAHAQQDHSDRHVGGPCQGCEAIYDYGEMRLASSVTLPGYDTAQIKLKINGTVYQNDGKTPAAGVILYFYHTNAAGVYQPAKKTNDWEKDHGALRGWIQTDENGTYEIKTNRPASYPKSRIPAHIHVTIKEVGLVPYYINDYYFSDDPFLTDSQRNPKNARGGSGVLSLTQIGSNFTATRDIVLGLNIPDY